MSDKKTILGILNADDLSPEVEKKFGNYFEIFEQLFVKKSFSFKFYQVTKNEYPDNIHDCDAFLITGSKFSCYENIAWIKKLKKFIKHLHTNNSKLIGICFGHQIIAEALGGEVGKSSNGWGFGVMHSEIVHYRSWMEPNIPTYALYVCHQDQVTILPEDAVCLASSDFCLNSSFQINENILTFQGHPEFSKEYLLQIMDKLRSSIGESTYTTAKKSLNLQRDTSIIIKWIENFILDR